MFSRTSLLRCAAVLAAGSLASSLSAGLIDWTDWTSGTVGTSGTATGVISSLGITVDYAGDVNFLQTGTGTNYWTEFSPAPYTGSSVIDNAPTPSEMIALSATNSTNTITFSQAVLNPVMAIVSLGRTSEAFHVNYTFDQSFAVLSEGKGYWPKNATTWSSGTYTLSGNTLTGKEFHGALQFDGWVSSISWTAAPGENWHGVTLGVPIPEPSSLLFLLTGGALGLVALRRRR